MCHLNQKLELTYPKARDPFEKVDLKSLDYSHQEDWDFEYGKMQSPVDIVSAKSEAHLRPDMAPMRINYGMVNSVEDNGYSIQVNVDGHAIINGRAFFLKQFHFHSQSEHTIDGEHFPLEAHFVHEAQDGRIAVIAVLYQLGEANTTLEQVLKKYFAKDEESKIRNIAPLLPKNKSYFHYLGSLTAPPLIENVEWYICKEILTISEEQLASFERNHAKNYRDLQPLNSRRMIEFTE